jgi:hypothetical protein
MGYKVTFFTLPKDAASGARGKELGALTFDSDKRAQAFSRGVGGLADSYIHVAELFDPNGGTVSAREAGELLAQIKTAMGSSSESTLSSAMRAEVVELQRKDLAGKLDQLCEILQAAAKSGAKITTTVGE